MASNALVALALAALAASCHAEERVIRSMSDFWSFVYEMKNAQGATSCDLTLETDLDFRERPLDAPLGSRGDGTCNKWSGTLIGNGHSVKYLQMENPLGNASLFCGIENATVQQLTFDATCSVSGNKAAMLAVVANRTKLSYVTNQGKVVGYFAAGLCETFLSDALYHLHGCANTGTVTSTGGHAGGLFGYASDYITISSSYNRGKVTHTPGSDASLVVGGLVARVSGHLRVEQCLNTGVVEGVNQVGGLVGFHEPAPNSFDDNFEFFKSNNTGIVQATGLSSIISVGGLVGGIICSDGQCSPRKFESCQNSGLVNASEDALLGGVGGLAGSIIIVAIDFEKCSNTGLVTGYTEKTIPMFYVAGFVGVAQYSNVSVSNCMNSGTVRVVEGEGAGFGFGLGQDSNSITYSNSANVGTVEGMVAYGFGYDTVKAENIVNVGTVSGNETYQTYKECRGNCTDEYRGSMGCTGDARDIELSNGEYRVCTTREKVVDLLNAKGGVTWDENLHLQLEVYEPQPAPIVVPSTENSALQCTLSMAALLGLVCAVLAW